MPKTTVSELSKQVDDLTALVGKLLESDKPARQRRKRKATSGDTLADQYTADELLAALHARLVADEVEAKVSGSGKSRMLYYRTGRAKGDLWVNVGEFI